MHEWSRSLLERRGQNLTDDGAPAPARGHVERDLGRYLGSESDRGPSIEL